MNELPEGWVWKKLGEVCETTSGGTPNRKDPSFYGGDIPWVKSGELDKGLIIDTEEKITEAAIKNSSAKIFPKGTLLIALYGATIGKLAFLGIDAATNQAICGIFESQKIDSKYLYQFLFYSKAGLVNQGIGGAQPNISQGILKNLDLPLPPLSVQQAIVTKIEEIFSELDHGVEQLKLARQQLKVYRQSVLKWAFEGRLTNLVVKDGELPDGWKEIRLGEVILDIEAGKSLKCDERPPNETEIGIVKVSAVTWGTYNELESKTCFSMDSYNPDYLIREGDFLFSRANTLELVGACVIVHRVSKRLMLSDKILRFYFSDKVLKPFVLYYLRSQKGRYEIEQKSSGNQMSMRNIGQGRIREIEFPLPPLSEQHQIVSEIERRLSVCDKLEETIEGSLKAAEVLRAGVLKRAFEGRLV